MITTSTPLTLVDLRKLFIDSSSSWNRDVWESGHHRFVVGRMENAARERKCELVNPIVHLGARQWAGRIKTNAAVVVFDLVDRTRKVPLASGLPQVGIRNSDDGSFAIRLYAGLSVPLEGKLQEGKQEGKVGVTMARVMVGRHSAATMEEIDKKFAASFDGLLRSVARFDRKVEFLKGRDCHEEEANALLTQAARCELVTWTRVGRIDKAFREKGEYTYWALLLQFAMENKRNPPLQQMDRIYEFYQMLVPD